MFTFETVKVENEAHVGPKTLPLCNLVYHALWQERLETHQGSYNRQICKPPLLALTQVQGITDDYIPHHCVSRIIELQVSIEIPNFVNCAMDHLHS